jgi:hypothetical protein
LLVPLVLVAQDPNLRYSNRRQGEASTDSFHRRQAVAQPDQGLAPLQWRPSEEPEGVMPCHKRDTDNAKHGANPEPGDYWHEMFCPIRVVLDVTPETVTFCETIKSTDENHWTWDLDVVHKVLKENFCEGIQYTSAGMKDKFCADVVPRGHAEFAEIYAKRRTEGC